MKQIVDSIKCLLDDMRQTFDGFNATPTREEARDLMAIKDLVLDLNINSTCRVRPSSNILQFPLGGRNARSTIQQ